MSTPSLSVNDALISWPLINALLPKVIMKASYIFSKEAYELSVKNWGYYFFCHSFCAIGMFQYFNIIQAFCALIASLLFCVFRLSYWRYFPSVLLVQFLSPLISPLCIVYSIMFLFFFLHPSGCMWICMSVCVNVLVCMNVIYNWYLRNLQFP